TFQFIKHDTLPTNDCIDYSCFISSLENGQGQEMMKTNQQKNKQNYQMLLFCRKTGLSIGYDEDNNTFKFCRLPVCKGIAPFDGYAYVCINDIILFFGGQHYKNSHIVSKSVHKYSIQGKKWTTFKDILPIPLHYCCGLLNEDSSYIYIIKGFNSKHYMKPKNEIKCVIQHWVRILKIRLGWIDDFNKIIIKY
ncbi:hypothetical protein RFI_39385, partial [Reticulomyxa filosa]